MCIRDRYYLVLSTSAHFMLLLSVTKKTALFINFFWEFTYTSDALLSFSYPCFRIFRFMTTIFHYWMFFTDINISLLTNSIANWYKQAACNKVGLTSTNSTKQNTINTQHNKYITLTYHNSYTQKIANTFRKHKYKIAYRTTNTIKKHINNTCLLYTSRCV